jgi:uncharacterized hydrophobic protein (TIGR00271 family)
MRQLIVKVPRGEGGEVLKLAEKHQGANLALIESGDQEKAWDLVFIHLDNREIGEFISELDSKPEVQVTLSPHSVLPMALPLSEVPDQIKNVRPRSPIEIWLNGLQSIGSWKGFLGYTLAASIVVWIGLYTDTIYLLVAAMLIAPFAGPAMNLAIGTATGDQRLIWRNLARYFSSLVLMILATAILSLMLGQRVATVTMVDTSKISSYALLLPLIAGAAGALNLSQPENNSLVTGTATGLLIAASLAPPAGLIGMSTAIQRYDMAVNGVFVLLLQLVGINLAGSLVFRLYGLKDKAIRYEPGGPVLFYVSLAVSAVGVAALLAWQFSSSPEFQRSTRSQQAVGEVQEVVNDSNLADLIEANLRFTRPATDSPETLLGVVYVQRKAEVDLPGDVIRQELTQSIQRAIQEQGFDVVPLIDVSVLEPPP